MKEIGIDIETYSSVDLAKCGVYRYAEAPDFTVLLLSYAVDGGAPVCCDLASGGTLPPEILAALTSPDVVKTAYNAVFERVCLGRYYGLHLDPAQWRCTMARAARLGLPLSLAQCAAFLRLDSQKMKEGWALIRYFSVPGRDGRRRLPSDDPERWDLFKQYNLRDVEVEQAVLAAVRQLPVPAFEEELYTADQEINDRGVAVDAALAAQADRLDAEYRGTLMERMRQLTGLENPNSPVQLKDWLRREAGVEAGSLDAEYREALMERLADCPAAREVLALRRETTRTSNRKYRAMLDCVCGDGRLHGLLQYYGAARTGRWAGRLVQVQNLPQNHLPDLDHARSLVRQGSLEELAMNYDSPSKVLSELIRTAFTAAPGQQLIVCDFSAIEARVLAWLAGEEWVLDVFRRGGDIYCAAASRMFGVPVEKHGRNAELRQKGKIAVLALGYGGGTAALEAMGGGRLGLTEDEEKDIVRQWRRANRSIVRLWSTLEDAAACAVRTGRSAEVTRGVAAGRWRGMLTLRLPSGRMLCYPRAAVAANGQIEYEGADQTTKQWTRIRTYGGKLAENVTQAVARDILGCVLLRARAAGLRTVFHVHDEIIVEAPPERTVGEVEALFAEGPGWCAGLPLRGVGYATPYYRKD
ncbi:MAG: DNA polymerase [Bacteroidales bacterium]|nr:DNA polymerase [Bacteroidales bacterium]